ncbi:MAG TPA: DUF2235 domain-containing protein [Hymenobacter sp.]|jgi:hypothetical protein|uniref:DUF2235 domain-containing protein n=1 Tax=Hymenobacter sp. TaxID=1898978 RepID=UPI002ED93D99
MSKNLVICCDGTWNSATDEAFGMPTPTNVHRLYQACQDRAESQEQQFVWYQPGVGALGGRIRRAFEGTTGTGVSANIRRGYTAVARHYEAGDRIFLLGFSRGAFTARSIAGMIQQVGLLVDPTAEAVREAYRYYESKRYNPALYAPGQYDRPDPTIHHLLHKPTRYVRVHFVGVWDTVSSLGFSFWGWSFNLRLFFRNGFHDLSPNRITDHVCHALAMDEMRTSFMPTLWEVPPGEPAAGDIEQVWFRGVHSDVGGGYAERDLADIAYRWLAERAISQGLLVRHGAFRDLAPNPAGRIHRSLQGPLWTNIGGWPRWFPPLHRTATQNAAVRTQGYLHESVFHRERICAEFGSKEPRLQTLDPGQSATVEIPADQLWTSTGLVLEQGGTYAFAPSGWWQDLNDTPVGAEGQPAATESWPKRLFRWARRAPDQPWMQLMGLVNRPRVWPWQERSLHEAVRYLVLEDPAELVADLFPIRRGTERTVRAPLPTDDATGLLWVFANDLWKTHVNNTGSLSLTVTRTT